MNNSSSNGDTQHQANLWTAVRLLAEGSDWKRDSGETLTAWAQRTIRAARPSTTPSAIEPSKDTERLNWLDRSGHWVTPHEGDAAKSWCEPRKQAHFYIEGRYTKAEGETAREAIDAAMDGHGEVAMKPCWIGLHSPTYKYGPEVFLTWEEICAGKKKPSIEHLGWFCSQCGQKFSRNVRAWGSATPSLWRRLICWRQTLGSSDDTAKEKNEK